MEFISQKLYDQIFVGLTNVVLRGGFAIPSQTDFITIFV